MAATLLHPHVHLTKTRAVCDAIRYSSSSVAGPSSRQQSRARDLQRRRSKTNLEQVDLVGPPDPISNIRPMFYAPVPSYTQSSSSSTQSSHRLPHPYSLSEFSQTSRRSGKQTSRFGLGLFNSYRDHIDRVSNRVEEAEMKLRVSKLGIDNVTQRFWKDNNIRFTKDLESWREQSHRRLAALPEEVDLQSRDQPRHQQQQQQGGDAVTKRSIEAAEELSKDESAFYANWLRANGRRNRAYNVLVWRQTWEQVRLGARVTLLRNWLATLMFLR